MAKINNDVAREFKVILTQYQDLLQEIEDNLRTCGLNKKEILTFFKQTGIQSKIEQLEDDFEHANALHQSVVRDTFTEGYISDAISTFEQAKTNINQALTQKVLESEQANQKQ